MKLSFLFIILLVHFICLPPFSGAGFCLNHTTQKVTQFCDGQNFTSSDLYFDTFKASTKKTRCNCYFTSETDTVITLSTKEYPLYGITSCSTTSRIAYRIFEVPGTSGIICGYKAEETNIKTGQRFQITFHNELANLENYCLNIKTTAVNNHILRGTCFSDTLAAADTSKNPVRTSKQFTTKQRQEGENTSVIAKHQGIHTITKVTTTTDATTIGTITSGTTSSVNVLQRTSSKHVGVPLTILLPLVFGWLFFIIVVVIGVIYFIRRNKRDNQTVQSKHIELAVDEDEANHTEQALVNMEDEYTVIGEKSGVSEQVRETNTDDIGECSEVSPQSTVVVTAKDGSGCNEDDGYLMPHDIKMKDSEPGSVYVTLANDNENGKEQDYTSLEPGSVYTTLNKERNDQQEYTTMAFGKGKKREHRREPTKK